MSVANSVSWLVAVNLCRPLVHHSDLEAAVVQIPQSIGSSWAQTNLFALKRLTEAIPVTVKTNQTITVHFPYFEAIAVPVGFYVFNKASLTGTVTIDRDV